MTSPKRRHGLGAVSLVVGHVLTSLPLSGPDVPRRKVEGGGGSGGPGATGSLPQRLENAASQSHNICTSRAD